MDRIIHNAYDNLIDGKISMRERHSQGPGGVRLQQRRDPNTPC